MELDSLSSTTLTPIEEGLALNTSSTLVRSAQSLTNSFATEAGPKKLVASIATRPRQGVLYPMGTTSPLHPPDQMDPAPPYTLNREPMGCADFSAATTAAVVATTVEAVTAVPTPVVSFVSTAEVPASFRPAAVSTPAASDSIDDAEKRAARLLRFLSPPKAPAPPVSVDDGGSADCPIHILNLYAGINNAGGVIEELNFDFAQVVAHFENDKLLAENLRHQGECPVFGDVDRLFTNRFRGSTSSQRTRLANHGQCGATLVG
jgi:hypothetical protein